METKEGGREGGEEGGTEGSRGEGGREGGKKGATGKKRRREEGGDKGGCGCKQGGGSLRACFSSASAFSALIRCDSASARSSPTSTRMLAESALPAALSPARRRRQPPSKHAAAVTVGRSSVGRPGRPED